MSNAVTIDYILHKLSKNENVKKYLTIEDVSLIKKQCSTELPKKIKNSEEIKPFIIKIVDNVIENKLTIVEYLVDTVRVYTVSTICNLIDCIIKNRQKIKKHKIKRLKKCKT